MTTETVSIKALRDRIEQLEAENLRLLETLKLVANLDEFIKAPYTTALSKYVSALEAVAEAAASFNWRLTEEDKPGLAPWVDYQDAKDLNDALQKLEQAKKELGK